MPLALVFSALLAVCGAVPHAAAAECLIPPAFDPGVGELYVCPPALGERHLIEYARRSYREEGLREDIWLNVRGVFDDLVWVNVGGRESNDTSFPAWGEIERVLTELSAIKAGDADRLARFLAPIERVAAATAEDRAVKDRVLGALRASTTRPANAPVRAVLYHVHLKPTPEIEARSVMPINHALSIPSHGDLFWAPRLGALSSGAESKIAVPAGIWTYGWNEAQAARFVAERYTGPQGPPFVMKFAHVYTRLAITEYHRFGFNDPAAITPERVAAYTAALAATGAVLRFTFAHDWDVVRETLFIGRPSHERP